MKAFETTATIDDASHLTLSEPLPELSGQRCRVIVLYPENKKQPSTWPEGFFESIHISDPAFERQPQGEAPPSRALDE